MSAKILNIIQIDLSNFRTGQTAFIRLRNISGYDKGEEGFISWPTYIKTPSNVIDYPNYLTSTDEFSSRQVGGGRPHMDRRACYQRDTARCRAERHVGTAGRGEHNIPSQ